MREYKYTLTVKCDTLEFCPMEATFTADTKGEATDAARRKGWLLKHSGDTCPSCVGEWQNEMD